MKIISWNKIFKFFSSYFFINKISVREGLVNFSIFLAGNEFTPTLVNERNSIAILTNSCSRSNCTLEFELKIKGQQLSIKMQPDDSDEEHDLFANMKRKYKYSSDSFSNSPNFKFSIDF